MLVDQKSPCIYDTFRWVVNFYVGYCTKLEPKNCKISLSIPVCLTGLDPGPIHSACHMQNTYKQYGVPCAACLTVSRRSDDEGWCAVKCTMDS